MLEKSCLIFVEEVFSFLGLIESKWPDDSLLECRYSYLFGDCIYLQFSDSVIAETFLSENSNFNGGSYKIFTLNGSYFPQGQIIDEPKKVDCIKRCSVPVLLDKKWVFNLEHEESAVQTILSFQKETEIDRMALVLSIIIHLFRDYNNTKEIDEYEKNCKALHNNFSGLNTNMTLNNYESFDLAEIQVQGEELQILINHIEGHNELEPIFASFNQSPERFLPRVHLLHSIFGLDLNDVLFSSVFLKSFLN
jgi:hypothetical protein